MIVTETEAAKLWCPFARLSTGLRSGQPERTDPNRFEEPYYPCIASKCAAWRWKDYSGGNGIGGPPQRRQPKDSEKQGFCGLAYSVRLP